MSAALIPRSTQGDYKRSVGKNANKEIPKGVGVCPTCHAIYFKKSWHNPDRLTLEKGLGTKSFEFHICGACKMIKDNAFEGEVIVKNVSPKYESDLAHLIAAYGRRAMVRDNQDRVATIEKTKGGFRVMTTENQLARKLGKKIEETFKGVEVTTSYLKSE